jgi:VanZ family protein
VIHFLKLIFNISVFLLILLSLFPGSIIGLLLYENVTYDPTSTQNFLFISLNHFITYFYVGLLGFFLYAKSKNLKKILYFLTFLSVILEISHALIPNRAFEINDLVSNILGVLVAYWVLKIYLLFKKL